MFDCRAFSLSAHDGHILSESMAFFILAIWFSGGGGFLVFPLVQREEAFALPFFRLYFDGVCCSGGLSYDELGFFEQQDCSELMLVMLSHSRVVYVFLDVMNEICI